MPDVISVRIKRTKEEGDGDNVGEVMKNFRK
jgi:hypothetical protein